MAAMFFRAYTIKKKKVCEQNTEEQMQVKKIKGSKLSERDVVCTAYWVMMNM